MGWSTTNLTLIEDSWVFPRCICVKSTTCPALTLHLYHFCSHLQPTFFNCLFIFLIGFLYGINNRAVFTQGSWNIQFSLEPMNVVPQRRQDDVYSELKILMCCENCVPCPVFTRYALLKLQPLASETNGLCVEIFTVLE